MHILGLLPLMNTSLVMNSWAYTLCCVLCTHFTLYGRQCNVTVGCRLSVVGGRLRSRLRRERRKNAAVGELERSRTCTSAVGAACSAVGGACDLLHSVTRKNPA